MLQLSLFKAINNLKDSMQMEIRKLRSENLQMLSNFKNKSLS